MIYTDRDRSHQSGRQSPFHVSINSDTCYARPLTRTILWPEAGPYRRYEATMLPERSVDFRELNALRWIAFSENRISSFTFFFFFEKGNIKSAVRMCVTDTFPTPFVEELLHGRMR